MAKDAKGHGSDGRGGGLTVTDSARARIASVINRGSGQAHVARIAQAHGIQGGPVKVQALDTSRAGQPWGTQKSFRNTTVAEHVAKYARMDNGKGTSPGGYMRVKVR